jgi:hypothetical protein
VEWVNEKGVYIHNWWPIDISALVMGWDEVEILLNLMGFNGLKISLRASQLVNHPTMKPETGKVQDAS